MPKINEMLKEWKSENPPYAFEFYPPRSKEAVEKLYERLVRSTFERLRHFFFFQNNITIQESMAEANPLYVDFTWGAGGSTSDLTLELAVQAKKRYGLEPNMHLTCTYNTHFYHSNTTQK